MIIYPVAIVKEKGIPPGHRGAKHPRGAQITHTRLEKVVELVVAAAGEFTELLEVLLD